jgi:uncharacterized protein YecE (DUF72 family)
MSHPKLPAMVLQNTPVLYYRFHRVPEAYKSGYTEAKLSRFTGEIDNSGTTPEAYIYFNNDLMHRPSSRRSMRSMTAKS